MDAKLELIDEREMADDAAVVLSYEERRPVTGASSAGDDR